MAKGIHGRAYCDRCGKETTFHLSAVTLYGVSFGKDRVCNGCDYVMRLVSRDEEGQDGD